MITPSFALTATERVLPRMALNFTTSNLDNRVTFTRSGNTATVTNSSGVITAINANLPRFDFNPTTLVCKGLLIEESRTNLLLNSLINGTNLSTQLVTTTANAHTLTFYGTGQIVLTGTSSATVVGTGAYPNGQTLTFTPTVGALTLTVTGTVQYAQLEVGAFSTSFIPTAALQVTRTADVAVMSGTNFSSWFNAAEGAFTGVAQTLSAAGSTQRIFSASTGSYADSISASSSGIDLYCQTFNGGALQSNLFLAGSASQTDFKFNFVYKSASFAASRNASALQTSAGTVPTVNQFGIGNEGGFTFFNGYIKQLRYYPQRLINAEIQAFSKG